MKVFYKIQLGTNKLTNVIYNKIISYKKPIFLKYKGNSNLFLDNSLQH